LPLSNKPEKTLGSLLTVYIHVFDARIMIPLSAVSPRRRDLSGKDVNHYNTYSIAAGNKYIIELGLRIELREV
ncbi:MAG: hypothetical protein WBC49_02460, partial [Thermoplasmata archaeon]